MARPTPWCVTKWNMRSCGSLDIDVVWFGGIKKHPKTFVRNDVGTSFCAKSASTTEVVWVTMRHNDGVHSLEWHTDFGESVIDCAPCCFARQTWVDNGNSARVFKYIHIDVAKARHIDRELSAQNVWSNFHNLCSCRHLFLFGVDLFAHVCT